MKRISKCCSAIDMVVIYNTVVKDYQVPVYHREDIWTFDILYLIVWSRLVPHVQCKFIVAQLVEHLFFIQSVFGSIPNI